MSDGERDTLIALVQKTVEDLGERFEAVQILVTTSDDDGTWTYDRGSGNFNARKGMVLRFLEMDQQIDQARFIANELNDDDGE